MGSASTWLGVGLIAVATLAGSVLAGRHADRRDLCFGAASSALLVIAGIPMLPDAWSDARETGLPVATVPLVAVAAFALTGWLNQRGRTCVGDRGAAGGIGATVALAGHRVLDGAALAVTGRSRSRRTPAPRASLRARCSRRHPGGGRRCGSPCCA